MPIYNIKFQGCFLRINTEQDKKIFEDIKSEVETKLNEVQNCHNQIPLEKALFLSCLQLAEDKFLLKQAIDKNINQLESQTKSILKDLESTPSGTRLEMSL